MAAGAFTLVWTGGALDSKVLSFELTQSEGDFASLSIEVPNPRIGLLNPGEPLTATLAWDSGSGSVDLFAGRLVGIPENLQGEVVKLTFLAKPEDYDAQKIALAETLKVAPFWDPVFVPPDRVDDPDFVLEARPQLWHIDRVTNSVTVSDILEGEDGLLALGGGFFYDSLNVTYGAPPATAVNFKAELSWKQAGKGSIDLSGAIEDAFAEGGYQARGYLASYTGAGLMSAWPRTGANIGSGWKVGLSYCELSDVLPEAFIKVSARQGGFSGNSNSGINQTITLLTNPGDPTIDLGDPLFTDAEIGWIDPQQTYSAQAGCTNVNYYNQSGASVGGGSLVGFSLWALQGVFNADYDVERARKETVTFTLNADVQPVVSATDQNVIDVSLSTSQVGDPVDPGGLTPIRDARRTSYMLTDRGKQSLEYMIVYSRAKLLARARAVTVTFETEFANVADLTLRHSAQIEDARLPGGQATGKVTGLSFALNGDDGQMKAQVTLGCTIGTGASLAPAVAGADTYATGYFGAGYAATSGGGTTLASGDISYVNFDQTAVTDDGVDFFDMQASQIILSLVVLNGAKYQEWLLTSVTYDDTNAAIATLNDHCTKVALALRPLTVSEAFETPFALTISDLMIPKTIDLEAGSLA